MLLSLHPHTPISMWICFFARNVAHIFFFFGLARVGVRTLFEGVRWQWSTPRVPRSPIVSFAPRLPAKARPLALSLLRSLGGEGGRHAGHEE
uniref:Uncharacterized protein n=1 Tax=Leishmania guyanensis TaxID=5670 RepID=A0A1E1IWW6_LEIGU|nr:Hypothetical protein BN36_2333130 [Leishmania guyanensis]